MKLFTPVNPKLTSLSTRSPWWKWEWNRIDCKTTPGHGYELEMPLKRLRRWHRGWITFYCFDSPEGDRQWWVYLPFNIGLGFGYSK